MFKYTKLEGRGFCNACEEIEENCLLVTIPTLSHQAVFVIGTKCLVAMRDVCDPPLAQGVIWMQGWQPK